jgi:hypothetical protein
MFNVVTQDKKGRLRVARRFEDNIQAQKWAKMFERVNPADKAWVENTEES